MVEINLLPWREHARLYQARRMKQALLSLLLLGMVFVAGMHKYLSSEQGTLEVRIAKLKREINRYDVQKERPLQSSALSAESIQSLRRQQTAIQALFAELANLKEGEMCFTKISRAQDRVSFSGHARSAAGLTEFLTQWPAANLFSEIKLEQLEREKNDFLRFRFLAMGNTP